MDRTEFQTAPRSPTVGLFFAVLLTHATTPSSRAQGPLPVPPGEERPPLVVPDAVTPAPLPDVDDDTGTTLQAGWARLMRELSEDVVPPGYEVLRDWGNTTEVFAGFSVRTDNGRLRVSKRTRRVNHGLWRRFRVQLVRPADRLRIELRNVRLADEGGLIGEIVLTARLRCTAEAAYWNYGVLGPNTNVVTDLTLRGVSEWRLLLVDNDPDAWIPEYALLVEARRVRLRILDFDVRRIGVIGGEIADELGDASREIVEELLERQESQVLRRLQRATEQLH